jgi:hypothetical protein
VKLLGVRGSEHAEDDDEIPAPDLTPAVKAAKQAHEEIRAKAYAKVRKRI